MLRMQEVGGSIPLTSRTGFNFHNEKAVNNFGFLLNYYRESMFPEYKGHLIIQGNRTILLEVQNPAFEEVKDSLNNNILILHYDLVTL